MDEISALDLIFFNGSEIVSKAIRCIQKRHMRYTGKGKAPRGCRKVWSHVGLVVTRELYDDPRLQPGKLYVLESTMSGSNGDGVLNIDGEGFLGVQIRDLDALITKYTRHPEMEIGWAKLKHNPFSNDPKVRTPNNSNLVDLVPMQHERNRCQNLFTSWCKWEWEGQRYDVNLISLGGAVCQNLRPVRALIARFCNVNGWYFCSELVFRVLQVLGVYDMRYDSRNVVPMDLLGWDADDPPIPSRFECVKVFQLK